MKEGDCYFERSEKSYEDPSHAFGMTALVDAFGMTALVDAFRMTALVHAFRMTCGPGDTVSG